MKEKRLITRVRDICSLEAWLQDTLWELYRKKELPVVVEIEIRKEKISECGFRISESTEQTEQTETTEQTE